MRAPHPPRGRLERLTWPLRHPLVFAVAVVVLAALLARLDTSSHRMTDRLLGSATDRWMASRSVYVYRRAPGSYEVIDPDKESMNRLPRLFQDQAHDLIAATSLLKEERRGWLFPIHKSVTRSIVLEPLGTQQHGGKPDFTPAELREAGAEFERFLAEEERGLATSAILSDDARMDRILFGHLLMNVAVVVMAAVAVFSLVGSVRYVRVSIAGRRLAAGECGVCRYDLSRVPTEDGRVRCPECGTEWAVRTGAEGTAPQLWFLG